MAAGRPGRPSTGPAAARRHLLASALAASLLLLLAAASLLLSSASPSAPAADPRLSLLLHHASSHLALLNAYASYSRRLKLLSDSHLQTFSSFSSSLADVSSRLADPIPDDDTLRPLEQSTRSLIKSARALISDTKDSFDTHLKIQKLRDTIFAATEQLSRANKLTSVSSRIAAASTPKSLHCLNMRLMAHYIAHPHLYANKNNLHHSSGLYHYVIFSNNVIAVSVVINSVVRNADDPSLHVFHVVTDSMYYAAMKVWFVMRPVESAEVEIRSVKEFGFLNETYSPVVREIGKGRRDLVLLDYLRFYLPEMYPGLRRVVFLEDDVVVQRDLTGLWRVDMDGKVNGAVEMCFGGFKRYNRFMNFSDPAVRERFNPRACAWGYGVNVFDLDAWRREQCTEKFHQYQMLNEGGTLWMPESVLSAGLMTFYASTKPLDKSWHAMGLGYNPSISPDEIRNAAVIHFNGNMKPWLDIAMNQYKNLWSKYVDTEMEFLQLCNFGV